MSTAPAYVKDSRPNLNRQKAIVAPRRVRMLVSAFSEKTMLTGYNQDVQAGDELLHVQTEDKGRDKALLETLVYRGGTIIAAKRTSYSAQLSAGTLNDDDLSEMLKKQHQIIVAILKAGKVEELVRASQKAAAKEAGEEAPVAVAPPPVPLPVPEIVAEPEEVDVMSLAPEPVVPAAPPESWEPMFPQPAPEEPRPVVVPELDAAGRAVIQRVTGPLTGELDLDKIISDYLQSGLQKEKLRLRLLGRTDFLAGDTVVLQVQATRGTGQPIEAASVVVKVIGTAFKPQIFPGRTDREGIASFNIVLPTFTAGSAAVVVQASSKYGDGEIKHLIRRR